MSKRTLLTPASSLCLALSLGLVGCDEGPAAAAGDDAAEAADLGGALDRLRAEFHVLDAAGLGPDLSAEEARARVAGAAGLGLDLAALDRDAIASYKPLFFAAMEVGVPMIVEHADDAESLAALIGVGVEADVAMVTSLGPNRLRVRVYGGGGELDASFESADGELGAAEWSADVVTHAVDEIGATLRHGASTEFHAALTPSLVPENGYLYYDFDTAEESFSPTSGQTASLSMDFEAELALDSARGKKVVFMRPIGSGQHPGTLISDSSSNRGYYQESQEVSLAPNNASVSLYAHEPSTANASTTYTSSTGWTIGTESGWPALSYSTSDQTSTTLSDFSMVNNTSGSTASWTFAMTSSWSSMFYHPAFEKCKVKSLPNLAKSNLNPQYEVFYRADDSFTSSVTFTFTKITLLRRIWRGGDIVTCKKYSDLWTLTRSRDVSINFGAI